jgi:hypothetical protein
MDFICKEILLKVRYESQIRKLDENLMPITHVYLLRLYKILPIDMIL